MSIDTFVEFVYGLPVYGREEYFAEKFSEIFPDFAKDFLNEESKVADPDAFLRELSGRMIFQERFPGLRMQVTEDGFVLIILAGSNTNIYYKYEVNLGGVTRPEKDMPSKKPLKKFAKEFDLGEKPQAIIWSYDEDPDDESTWVKPNFY